MRIRIAVLKFNLWANLNGRRLRFLALPGMLIFLAMGAFFLSQGQGIVLSLLGGLLFAVILVSVVRTSMIAVPRERIDAQSEYFRDRIACLEGDESRDLVRLERPPTWRLVVFTVGSLTGLALAIALRWVPGLGSMVSTIAIFGVLFISIVSRRRIYGGQRANPGDRQVPRAHVMPDSQDESVHNRTGDD